VPYNGESANLLEKALGIAVTTLLILMKWKIREPIIIAVAGLLSLAIRLRA